MYLLYFGEKGKKDKKMERMRRGDRIIEEGRESYNKAGSKN